MEQTLEEIIAAKKVEKLVAKKAAVAKKGPKGAPKGAQKSKQTPAARVVKGGKAGKTAPAPQKQQQQRQQLQQQQRQQQQQRLQQQQQRQQPRVPNQRSMQRLPAQFTQPIYNTAMQAAMVRPQKLTSFRGAGDGAPKAKHVGGLSTKGNGKIFISNLFNAVTSEDIQELFSKFGKIKSANVNYNKDGKSLGTAEVFFVLREAALAAIKEYHNVKLDGMPMNIELMVVAPVAAAPIPTLPVFQQPQFLAPSIMQSQFQPFQQPLPRKKGKVLKNVKGLAVPVIVKSAQASAGKSKKSVVNSKAIIPKKGAAQTPPPQESKGRCRRRRQERS